MKIVWSPVLWSELVESPPALQYTINMLASAEKCLACDKASQDLAECDAMATPLRFADDTHTGWERLIASDRKRLGDTD